MSCHTEVVFWKLQRVQRNMTQVPLCCEDDTQTKKYSVKVKKLNKRCYCMIYGFQMAEGVCTLNSKVRQKVALSWASKNGRTQMRRREERMHRAMAKRQSVFFPFFFLLHFPPFPFPKLKSTRRGLRMKIMVWRCICSNIIKEITYFFTFSIMVRINLGL